MVLCWYQQWFEKNGEHNNAFPPFLHPIYRRNCRHVELNDPLRMRSRSVRCTVESRRYQTGSGKQPWHLTIDHHMAWLALMASKKVSVSSTSLSMTLPISCQICLGKVSVVKKYWDSVICESHVPVLWRNVECCVVHFLIPKVREPVVCPNQHVFCSNCMDMWLRSHSFCPTCRTSITAEKPCKKILGKKWKIFFVFDCI